MIEVKTGDKVRVDGVIATVDARWAAGRHVQFTLSDGRKMVDLHKRDDVEVIAEKSKKKEIKFKPRDTRDYGTVEDIRDTTPNGEDLLD